MANATLIARTTPRRAEPHWRPSAPARGADVLGVCSAALDRLDIAHRFPRPDTISVARREALAALDAVVNPKA
ncbi:hypothetical protein K1T35_15880 [Pseudonocardia sp. DSM 110487]|uniref:hypothetical protein n=1 Tax=Pseudonocardia sp. DSM 110487 TaxID=2865833 RepID=UPI001C695B45|nr:hypothetical protein [Pseudonocardia sp. DSM 110487]QYN38565.1 hypothetical protein K1T35_15880 [Pseudonocardia sp. DSM 110487]